MKVYLTQVNLMSYYSFRKVFLYSMRYVLLYFKGPGLWVSIRGCTFLFIRVKNAHAKANIYRARITKYVTHERQNRLHCWIRVCWLTKTFLQAKTFTKKMLTLFLQAKTFTKKMLTPFFASKKKYFFGKVFKTFLKKGLL